MLCYIMFTLRVTKLQSYQTWPSRSGPVLLTRVFGLLSCCHVVQQQLQGNCKMHLWPQGGACVNDGPRSGGEGSGSRGQTRLREYR